MKWRSLGPEQVLDGVGELGSDRTLRTVNEPSVLSPAKLSSSMLELGCCRLMALFAAVPENVIFTGFSCAETLATPA
jgi:hypothetical protein